MSKHFRIVVFQLFDNSTALKATTFFLCPSKVTRARMRPSKDVIKPFCTRCTVSIRARSRAFTSSTRPGTLLKCVSAKSDRRWNSTASTNTTPFVPRQIGLAPHHGTPPKLFYNSTRHLKARSHKAENMIGPRASKTHSCGELSDSLEGHHVVLGGWLFSQRYVAPLAVTVADWQGTTLDELLQTSISLHYAIRAVPSNSSPENRGYLND